MRGGSEGGDPVTRLHGDYPLTRPVKVFPAPLKGEGTKLELNPLAPLGERVARSAG